MVNSSPDSLDVTRKPLLRPWAVEWSPASSAAHDPAFWKKWWENADIIWDHSLLKWTDYDVYFLRLTGPGDLILEAGCGNGAIMKFLEDNSRKRAIGLDFSIDTLRAVKRKAPAMKLVCGDCRRLPFRRGVFDAIFSLGVIEHFPEGPEKLLDEMHDVLKPDGRMILTVPVLNLMERLAHIFDARKKFTPGKVFYQYLFRGAEIEELCAKSGFESVFVDYCNRLGVWYHYYSRIMNLIRGSRATGSSTRDDAPVKRDLSSEGASSEGNMKRLEWILPIARFIPGILSASLVMYDCRSK